MKPDTPARQDAARLEAARLEAARLEAARRRRLAEVFGDVLPQTPPADAADDDAAAGRDAELRHDLPPHHGA